MARNKMAKKNATNKVAGKARPKKTWSKRMNAPMKVAGRAGRTVLPEKTLTKKDAFNAPMKAAGKALETTSTKKKSHPMKATGKALPPTTPKKTLTKKNKLNAPLLWNQVMLHARRRGIQLFGQVVRNPGYWYDRESKFQKAKKSMALALTMLARVHDDVKDAGQMEESFESAHIDHSGKVGYANRNATPIHLTLEDVRERLEEMQGRVVRELAGIKEQHT